MAICRKCNTPNEEGVTRCKSCNAILPVKLGSKSEVRYERVRRDAQLVGTKCPRCETVNPYTKFRCKSCGTALGSGAKAGQGLARAWLYLGLGAAALAIVLAVAMRGM
jgi:hypothetical protein